MSVRSNPHVKERSKYSSANPLAVLEAVRDAGAGGVAVSDLFDKYGGRSEVLLILVIAIELGYVDLQWLANTDEYGLALANQRLREAEPSKAQ